MKIVQAKIENFRGIARGTVHFDGHSVDGLGEAPPRARTLPLVGQLVQFVGGTTKRRHRSD